MATRRLLLPGVAQQSSIPASLLGAATVTDSAWPLQASAMRRMAKRTVDLVLGCFAIAIALPLAAALCLAIIIDSPGSPIFVHRRVGRSGKEFGVLKFRTMVPGAQHSLIDCLEARPVAMYEWQDLHKVHDDPRVTRLGRGLRRLSIDEIPQLINVVRGQMSLVGPRPIMEEELERFGEHAPVILSVRPGLTGLWAVSGRTDLSYDARVALESRYVRDWCWTLDVSILLRTIPTVLSGRGAC